MLDTVSRDLDANGLSRPTVFRILCSIRPARTIQDARRSGMRGARRTRVPIPMGAYATAPRERGGTHRRWVTADGPFSAACPATPPAAEVCRKRWEGPGLRP